MADLMFDLPLDGIATPTGGDLSIAPPSRADTISPMPERNLSSQSPLLALDTDTFFADAIASPSASLGAVSFAPSEPAVTSAPAIPEPIFETADSESADNKPTSAQLQSPGEVKKPIRKQRERKPTKNRPAASEDKTAAKTATKEPAKAKKRVRKSKKAIEQDVVVTKVEELEELEGLDDLDDLDVPKNGRRRRILERNRIAATKCRLRKRDEASALASREQALEDQNRYLSMCFDSLTADIYNLKSQLLRHTDCNCVLIQKYISAEAKKSVNSMLGLPISPSHHTGSTSPEFGCSSRNSTAESMNVHSPDIDNVQTPWMHALQTPMPKTEMSDFLATVDLDGFPKTPLNVSPAVPGPQIVEAPVDAGCMGGLYIDLGPHVPTADEMTWNTTW